MKGWLRKQSKANSVRTRWDIIIAHSPSNFIPISYKKHFRQTLTPSRHTNPP